MTDKLAVFGTGCNPIGLHHEKIAQSIWDKFKMKTWIMPCSTHRFEKNSELVDAVFRWEMACHGCNDKEFMIPLDYEYKKQSTGSTFETMKELSQMMSKKQLFVVIGMDNANIIESKWHRGKELIKKFPFIVIKRSGVDQEVDWFEKEPHLIVELESEGSSSQIRKAIKDGDYSLAKSMLNENVWNHIKIEKLYGYKD